jgi:SAM-dependent methyltransferase
MDMNSKALIGYSSILYEFAADASRLDDYANSFSDTQRLSKEWLVRQLVSLKFTKLPHVLILGCWYGSYLIPLLAANCQVKKVTLIDRDAFSLEKAATLARSLGLKANAWPGDVADYYEKIDELDADAMINTSCEHMAAMPDLRVDRTGCVYVYQSTNSTNDPGHINTVNSSQELQEQSGIDDLLFRGSLQLRKDKVRFMVIGKRA